MASKKSVLGYNEERKKKKNLLNPNFFRGDPNSAVSVQMTLESFFTIEPYVTNRSMMKTTSSPFLNGNMISLNFIF